MRSLGLVLVGALGAASLAAGCARGMESGAGGENRFRDVGPRDVSQSGREAVPSRDARHEATAMPDLPPDSMAGASREARVPPPVDARALDSPPPPPPPPPVDAGPALQCDILAQDCTAAGTKCVPELSSSGTLLTRCVTAGSGTQGASCTAMGTGDSCAKGLVCVGASGGGASCAALCGKCDPTSTANPCPKPMTSTYCNPGGSPPTYCVATAVPPGSTAPIAQLCVTSCDIFNPKTCTTDTGGSGACYVANGGPLCVAPPGTGVSGSACSTVPMCVAGDSCFGACYRTCKLGGPSTQCPSGLSCVSASDPDIPGLGACN